MPSRPFRCTECGRTLGAVTHDRDRRGRVRLRIALERDIDTRWRWFRLYARCPCGEDVRLPEGATVSHRT